MKRWLKYGKNGAIVGLVLGFVALVGLMNCNGIGCLPFVFPILPAVLLIELLGTNYTASLNFVYFLINVLAFFIVGAIVGLIVDKVKSKKINN